MANRSKRKSTQPLELSFSPELETRIGLIDEFDEKCTQAIAIASLLMEADTDKQVQDSVWAIRSLVERAVTIAKQVLASPDHRKSR